MDFLKPGEETRKKDAAAWCPLQGLEWCTMQTPWCLLIVFACFCFNHLFFSRLVFRFPHEISHADWCTLNKIRRIVFYLWLFRFDFGLQNIFTYSFEIPRINERIIQNQEPDFVHKLDSVFCYIALVVSSVCIARTTRIMKRREKTQDPMPPGLPYRNEMEWVFAKKKERTHLWKIAWQMEGLLSRCIFPQYTTSQSGQWGSGIPALSGLSTPGALVASGWNRLGGSTWGLPNTSRNILT